MEVSSESRTSFLRSPGWNFSISSEIITPHGFPIRLNSLRVIGSNAIRKHQSNEFQSHGNRSTASGFSMLRNLVFSPEVSEQTSIHPEFAPRNSPYPPPMSTIGLRCDTHAFRYTSFSIAMPPKSIASTVQKNDRQNLPATFFPCRRTPRIWKSTVMRIRVSHIRRGSVTTNRSMSDLGSEAYIERLLQMAIIRRPGIQETIRRYF